MILGLIRKAIPASLLARLKRCRAERRRARIQTLPAFTEDTFRETLHDNLGVRPGDVLFVHSSVDRLNLAFPFFRILDLLLEAVGEEGTLLFPTYPQLGSYAFLSSDQVFDVRKTPSYTGVLSEFARRHSRAIRSLHPTKSVCAIGPLASELTRDHATSPFPYDVNSPYHKIIPLDGKILGIGVTTSNLSFVHCVDDALGDEFPVEPYHPTPFEGRCIDAEGRLVQVPSYAHDMGKMNHDIPGYMRAHVPPDVCQDLLIQGQPFFRAMSRPLFEEMVRLARQGTTIYRRAAYRSRKVPGHRG